MQPIEGGLENPEVKERRGRIGAHLVDPSKSIPMLNDKCIKNGVD